MPKKQATPQHLRLGEYHPHYGGHYAGYIRGHDGQPDYHLFVAPKDRGQANELGWGGFGQRTEAAEHTHDGRANTDALLKDPQPHPAAKFCADLTIDGHKDWYLPSREELRLAFVNCREIFDELWYWSSTQYAGSSNDAWAQLFNDGTQYYYLKVLKLRVRAVRRLVI
jgi:hypothetical protein